MHWLREQQKSTPKTRSASRIFWPGGRTELEREGAATGGTFDAIDYRSLFPLSGFLSLPGFALIASQVARTDAPHGTNRRIEGGDNGAAGFAHHEVANQK